MHRVFGSAPIVVLQPKTGIEKVPKNSTIHNFWPLKESRLEDLLGLVIGGHDCLQKPQLPCPPTCSSSLSTFVEHQYLQMKKYAYTMDRQ